jgi:hypothetical protein
MVEDWESEELAIIADPGYGLRDRNKPMLWFTVRMLCGEALQAFHQPRADEILTSGDVTDVKHLAGRPCVVSRTGDGVSFVRFLS